MLFCIDFCSLIQNIFQNRDQNVGNWGITQWFTLIQKNTLSILFNYPWRTDEHTQNTHILKNLRNQTSQNYYQSQKIKKANWNSNVIWNLLKMRIILLEIVLFILSKDAAAQQHSHTWMFVRWKGCVRDEGESCCT